MPGMQDTRFEKTVIYICAHSADGAMGLVVNKPFDAISFPDLLEQLGVTEYGGGNRIEIQSGGPVRITGEEIVQLVEPWEEEDLYAFWVDVRPDDTVDFALSAHFPEIDRFLNLTAQAGFEMEHGWFTDFTVEELKLGDWDLGQYTRGQQLAENANQSMANQRSQDPDVARALDQIDHLWIEDGAIWVELAPDGWEELMRARQ